MKTKLLNILRLVFLFKPFEAALTYYTCGSTFGSFLSKIPPNHYQYKTPNSRKVKRNGIHYNLDISDIIDWYIYYGFREKSKELLLENIKENDTVIDVGANVGEISLRAANIVGNKIGKIYSFEPDHINFNRFLNNMKINAVKNITPINKGLGNVDGVFNLSVVDENNRGMNRIVESNESLNTSKIEVIILDNYIKLKNITRVDLIKIDTEGFEMNVIIGAKDLLKRFRPILFIELDEKNLIDQNSSPKELIKHLINLNYNIVNANNNDTISLNSDLSNCHFDIICKPIAN